ncbi:hypothetical protein Val02_52030 [Virgisporangium aliadipatigenens]|uniref:Uncharacterized protein n=1 Tax=Virgisporangium aliadipatigenens TaxID=741659 RepID=A0A8J3YPQ6_9ACTN|nr:hypothetical protein Val02_52030 [Virgisporangium aliadipatigenens]
MGYIVDLPTAIVGHPPIGHHRPKGSPAGTVGCEKITVRRPPQERAALSATGNVCVDDYRAGT